MVENRGSTAVGKSEMTGETIDRKVNEVAKKIHDMASKGIGIPLIMLHLKLTELDFLQNGAFDIALEEGEAAYQKSRYKKNKD